MSDDAFHPYDEPAHLRALAARTPDYADVQYAIIEGFRPLLLDLTLPSNASGAVPLVVCIHGGAWITGSHKATHDDYVGYPMVWDALLAEGLAVASIQYRHSGEAAFPAQLHDAKAAVRWLRRFGPELGIDTDRIGVWGESAGGHLAALLAMNTSDPTLEGEVGVVGVPSTVNAAVLWYPPTDLTTLQVQMIGGSTVDHDELDSPESLLLGTTITSAPTLARWASPVTHVSAAAAPMVLIHGDADTVVPFAQSRGLFDALKAAGIEAELVRVAGAEHCFTGVDARPIASRTAADFARLLAR